MWPRWHIKPKTQRNPRNAQRAGHSGRSGSQREQSRIHQDQGTPTALFLLCLTAWEGSTLPCAHPAAAPLGPLAWPEKAWGNCDLIVIFQGFLQAGCYDRMTVSFGSGEN